MILVKKARKTIYFSIIKKSNFSQIFQYPQILIAIHNLIIHNLMYEILFSVLILFLSQNRKFVTMNLSYIFKYFKFQILSITKN